MSAAWWSASVARQRSEWSTRTLVLALLGSLGQDSRRLLGVLSGMIRGANPIR
jgi:hypothetical protein